MTAETEAAIAGLAGMLAAMEQAAGTQSSAAFTMRELKDYTGRGERRCGSLIRAGISAGILRPSRKRITDLAGRSQTIAAYEQVKQ